MPLPFRPTAFVAVGLPDSPDSQPEPAQELPLHSRHSMDEHPEPPPSRPPQPKLNEPPAELEKEEHLPPLERSDCAEPSPEPRSGLPRCCQPPAFVPESLGLIAGLQGLKEQIAPPESEAQNSPPTPPLQRPEPYS